MPIKIKEKQKQPIKNMIDMEVALEERAALWEPKSEQPTQPATVVLMMQSVYYALMSQAAQDLDHHRKGWLIGRELIHKNQQYVLVEQILAHDDTKDFPTFDMTAREGHDKLYFSNKIRVGWYRIQPQNFFQLFTQKDVQIHKNYFRNPYQVGLIMATDVANHHVPFSRNNIAVEGGFLVWQQAPQLENEESQTTEAETDDTDVLLVLSADDLFGFIELSDTQDRSVINWRNMKRLD